MDTFPNPEKQKELLIRLRQGDGAAFEILYNLHKRRIETNLLRLLKSEQLVQEVMQELFLKVWQNRQSLDPERSLSAYLVKVSENMVYDMFRKAARDKKLLAGLLSTLVGSYTHVEEDIFHSEHKELLHEAIGRLPPQRRLVFTLCKLEGKSYNQVSEQLGISHAAINDHLVKANRFLKKKLSPASLLMVSALAMAILHGI